MVILTAQRSGAAINGQKNKIQRTWKLINLQT